jgi:hypothetical protein
MLIVLQLVFSLHQCQLPIGRWTLSTQQNDTQHNDAGIFVMPSVVMLTVNEQQISDNHIKHFFSSSLTLCAQCFETFYDRNLLMLVISASPWQSFTA